MGLQQIQLGQKAKSVAIERFRGVEGRPIVISVVSEAIDVADIHYHPAIGYFYSFGGQDVKDLGLPSQRYILPVIEYSQTGAGILDYGAPLSIKYLSLSKGEYETNFLSKIEVCQAQGSSLAKKDIKVLCTDAKYNKCTYDLLGDAKWRADESMKAQVKEMFRTYKNLIQLSVARVIDEQRYLELIAGQGDNDGKPLSKKQNESIRQKTLGNSQQRALPDSSSVGTDQSQVKVPEGVDDDLFEDDVDLK